MKKTKSCTYTWTTRNYGSVLQAFALNYILSKNGIDNYFVDYRPGRSERILFLMKNHYKIRLIKEKIAAYKFNNYSSEVTKHNKVKDNKFDAFIKRNFKFTQTIYFERDMKKLSNEYDVYICGSDQLWNPAYFKKINFLDGIYGKKKISYATSVGMTNIHEKLKKKYHNFLNDFCSISVREKTGEKLLSSMIDKRIDVVLDPTLLLTKDEWNSISSVEEKNKPYILCYFLGENKLYWNIADKISQILDIDVWLIPVTTDALNKKYNIVYEVGPVEWINLIKNADFVLTDSFHGTAFSVIFNKNFYNIKRFSDADPTSQNSRVQDLLSEIDLEERVIAPDKDIFCRDDLFIDTDQYRSVSDRIERLREYSINWLLNAVNNNIRG